MGEPLVPQGSSSPGIIYALVARGTCVLAEFTMTSGNFTTVTRRILEKLPSEDSKMSYVYDSHIFHYAVSGGLVFLCMADSEFGRRVPFAFLDDVIRRWQETYGQRGQTALAYGMNEDFSRVLQRQMDFYSRADRGGDTARRVQGEIDEVRDVMVANIEKVLQARAIPVPEHRALLFFCAPSLPPPPPRTTIAATNPCVAAPAPDAPPLLSRGRSAARRSSCSSTRRTG